MAFRLTAKLAFRDSCPREKVTLVALRTEGSWRCAETARGRDKLRVTTSGSNTAAQLAKHVPI